MRKWRTLGVRVFVDAEGIKDCFFMLLNLWIKTLVHYM